MAKNTGWIITAIIAFLIAIGAIPVGLFTFYFLGLTSKVIFVILLAVAILALLFRSKK